MSSRRGQRLSNVLLLSSAPEPAAEILPSLSLLPHAVRLAPAVAASADGTPPADLVLVDARRDLVQVRQLLRQLRAVGLDVPVLAIVAEGGWAAVSADWGADDVILHTAGPGEVDARLRIAIGRTAPAVSGEIRSGDLAIDEITYSARLHGRALDLTFKEFELLKFLAQSPGRVFSRSQLLQEVWGYDYFGGTRTVDVHVRRLRAKLGTEHEALIGTVRNVGYRFVPVKGDAERGAQDAGADSGEPDSPELGAAEPGAAEPGTAEPDTAKQQGPHQDRRSGSTERDGDPDPDRSPPAPRANAVERREARSAHAERLP
jgi:DNA-binding response OmpR family regulator